MGDRWGNQAAQLAQPAFNGASSARGSQRAEQGSLGESALAQVAEQLRCIERGAGWSRTLAIGGLMVTALFNGELKQWQNGAKAGRRSLRELAARPDCPLRKSALNQALAVYAFCRENPQIQGLERIAPGHVAAVLKCGPTERLQLLQRAQDESLGVKALTLMASALRDAARSTPARDAARVLSSLRGIEKSLNQLVPRLSEQREWLDSAAALKLDALVGGLHELVARVSRSVLSRAPAVFAAKVAAH